MTPEQLAALREVAEAAQADTPGSWAYANGYVRHGNATDRTGRSKSYTVCGISSPGANELRKADGQYGTQEEAQAVQRARGYHIAAFDPTTCLALLEEVERLTREVADLRKGLATQRASADPGWVY
jgi:hypothetical protein